MLFVMQGRYLCSIACVNQIKKVNLALQKKVKIVVIKGICGENCLGTMTCFCSKNGKERVKKA